MVAFNLQPMNAAAALGKPTNEIPLGSNQTANQEIKTDVFDLNTNISTEHKKKSDPENTKSKNSAREMSHVLVVYNPQGKLRTKFMDSNNNVIYQIPSEMVAKMEDQMMKLDTSTNIKG